ncbi:MAG: hypothetical protein HOG34_09680 [Bacteroidetes bacterium]|nr:hypothetical protein [Bacteroidota bacterium]
MTNSLNTYKRHCTARDHLARLIEKKYRANDLPVKSINNAFIRDFELYFRVDRNCNNNSTVKYLKKIRKIINFVLANDWISIDPFTGIKFHYEKTDWPFLADSELEVIENKSLSMPQPKRRIVCKS